VTEELPSMNSLHKMITGDGWAPWFTPVIPAIQEAEEDLSSRPAWSNMLVKPHLNK
jgi:hypothetical protein